MNKTACLIIIDSPDGSRRFITDEGTWTDDVVMAERFPDKYKAWDFLHRCFKGKTLPRFVSVVRKRVI